MCWTPSPLRGPRGGNRDRAEALAAGWWSSAALAGGTATSLLSEFPRRHQSETQWLQFTGGETEVKTGDLSCPGARLCCSPAVLSLPRLPMPSLLQNAVPVSSRVPFSLTPLGFRVIGFWGFFFHLGVQ